MRREELWDAINNVSAALAHLQLHRWLGDTTGRSAEKLDPSVVIKDLQEWLVFARTCGPNEREIIEIVGLEALEAPDLWKGVLSGQGQSLEGIIDAVQTVRFAAFQLPKFADLIRPESARKVQEAFGRGKPGTAKDLLRVIISEQEDQYSTAQRLGHLLISVADLYEVCLALEERKVPSNTDESLIVIGCDSGSDKSFDFWGIAEGVAGLKDLFHGLYDRIFFRKEHKTGLQLDLIAKSLPIYEKIAVLQQEGKIEPEQAEIYRRKITSGATQLVEARAIIPELEHRGIEYDPRKLLQGEPKLLDAPTGTPRATRKRRKKRNRKDSSKSASQV